MPEGWCWFRLGEITSELGDGIHGTPEYDLNGDYFFVNGNNLNNGKIIIKEDTKRVSITEFNKYKKNLNEKTVFVSINGTLGNVAFYNNEPIILGKSACYFNLHKVELKKYMFFFLNTEYFKKYAEKNATGSTIKNVSLKSMRELLLPLPPLNEQKLIVEEIEKIFAQIDLLEQNKTDLQTAIKQAKSKILDLAIHGKLVPQNTNDEPASVLLEKIRAEKEQKIANGELKRDKNDSFIYKSTTDNCHYQKNADGSIANIEDEIPFEVPEGWSWVRLSLLGEYKKGPFGSALTKSMFVPKAETTIKVYEQKNAIHKNSSLGDYYISKEYFETKMKSFEVFPGDIIVSCAGTIGETYILPKNIERGIINQALMRMKITDKINIGYFLMFFDHILKDESAKSGKGTAIKNIPPFDVFKQFLFPLPPLAEQTRIVAKIEELFTLLDNIQNNLI